MLGHGMTSGFLMRLRWDPRTSRRRNRDVEGGSNFRTSMSSNSQGNHAIPATGNNTRDREGERQQQQGNNSFLPARALPHRQHSDRSQDSTAAAVPPPLPCRQHRLPQGSLTSCLPWYIACVATVLPHLRARPYGTPRLGTTARTGQLRKDWPAMYWRCPPEPLTKGNNHVDYAQRLVLEPAVQPCLPACTVQTPIRTVTPCYTPFQ